MAGGGRPVLIPTNRVRNACFAGVLMLAFLALHGLLKAINRLYELRREEKRRKVARAKVLGILSHIYHKVSK